MKILNIILTIIALALIGYNITQINFDNPFNGDSLIALITILAALCAILLLRILVVSKKIEKSIKSKK
ncbi:hypothetical protein [Hanstruepera marina]|uniref:hypothetical protein n=1 Tax=Hanstruepera marina TaxID=2873265 RepID=UPI001CA6B729|nr:hypothetical protein [Hanstruepera marina]